MTTTTSPGDRSRQAKETLDKTMSLLPEEISSELKIVEPKTLTKGGINRMRGQICAKKTRGFWSATWCFFEVGVGSYKPRPGEGLNLGAVAFCCFPFNKACGGGKYSKEIERILSRAHRERPEEFVLVRPDQAAGRAFYVRERRYAGKSCPVDTAAKDVAWLIEQTFPAFEEMLNAG